MSTLVKTVNGQPADIDGNVNVESAPFIKTITFAEDNNFVAQDHAQDDGKFAYLYIIDDQSPSFSVTNSFEIPSAANYPGLIIRVSRTNSDNSFNTRVITGSNIIQDQYGNLSSTVPLNINDKFTWISNGTVWIMMEGTERPYKVYTALLNQSGSSTPTPTILENTLGVISFQRDDTGAYQILSDHLFTENKTVVFFTQTYVTKLFTVSINVDATIPLSTSSATGIPSDDLLINTPIEIRVYK